MVTSNLFLSEAAEIKYIMISQVKKEVRLKNKKETLKLIFCHAFHAPS